MFPYDHSQQSREYRIDREYPWRVIDQAWVWEHLHREYLNPTDHNRPFQFPHVNFHFLRKMFSILYSKLLVLQEITPRYVYESFVYRQLVVSIWRRWKTNKRTCQNTISINRRTSCVPISFSLTSGDGSLFPFVSICANRRDRRTGTFSVTVTLKSNEIQIRFEWISMNYYLTSRFLAVGWRVWVRLLKSSRIYSQKWYQIHIFIRAYFSH